MASDDWWRVMICVTRDTLAAPCLTKATELSTEACLSSNLTPKITTPFPFQSHPLQIRRRRRPHKIPRRQRTRLSAAVQPQGKECQRAHRSSVPRSPRPCVRAAAQPLLFQVFSHCGRLDRAYLVRGFEVTDNDNQVSGLGHGGDVLSFKHDNADA